MTAVDVFISYPHQDKATADAACAALEAEGIRCWIAPRDVAAGTEWAAAIVDALDRCRVMVLIFSSNANESKQIQREVQRAFDRGTPVVPLRIEGIEPTQSLAYYLGPVHWLDAFTPPLETHLERLAMAVKARLQEQMMPGNREVAGVSPRHASPDTRPWPAPPVSDAARRLHVRWMAAGAAAVAVAVYASITWFMSSAMNPATLPTAPASQQAAAIGGEFNGTMRCDKLPWTAGPLQAAVALSIKAGNIAFSRDVYSGDGRRKTGVESGTGIIDSDGTLQLTTSWVSQTSRFDGRYAGRLSADGGTLAGLQILLVDGTRYERRCTILLRKTEGT